MTVRLCVECGNEFDDPRRSGAPRSFCDLHQPRPKKPAVPVPAKLRGRPFTIAHFRQWSKRLRLKDGEPFVLEEWQAAFIEDVFAGFAECWLVVPEGNGKSSLIAVLILYCVEFSPEASIPVAAASRDQAQIIFHQAAGFVRRSEALRGRFATKPGLREIVLGEASKAKILAADADTGDGVIPDPLAVLDELHRHGTLELYRVWAGKLDKEGAQLVVISTAGVPGGEFEGVREEIRQGALEAHVDGCFGRYVGQSSVLHEYAVPGDGDVEDLELVKQANPFSGITVGSLAAKRSRPSWNLSHWRRLTCNVPTRADSAAITEAEWADAQVRDSRDEWLEIPAGERRWAGLDVGWKWDCTALVPLWAPTPEFRLFGTPTILEPPRDGTSMSPDVLKRAITVEHERGPIHTLVMDTSRAEDIAGWAEDELGCRVIDRAQTNTLAAIDFEAFMQALRQGWLRHTGDRMFRQHALNAIARTLPGGQTRFDRPKDARRVREEFQRTRVIDALTAATMVHATAAAELTAPPPSGPMIGWM